MSKSLDVLAIEPVDANGIIVLRVGSKQEERRILTAFMQGHPTTIRARLDERTVVDGVFHVVGVTRHRDVTGQLFYAFLLSTSAPVLKFSLMAHEPTDKLFGMILPPSDLLN